MNSSEMYHGLGLEGYRTVATYSENGKMISAVHSTRAAGCAECGRVHGVGRGRFVCKFVVL